MRLVFLLLALMALPAAAADRPVPAPLAPYAGKVVYVDFWASWCGPCGEAFPWLNQMQARYGAKLAVVGVNVDTDARAADKFLVKHPASFAIVRDPQGALPEFYAIEGMPSAVILDARGRVLHQHAGFRADEVAHYEAAIQSALNTQEVRP